MNTQEIREELRRMLEAHQDILESVCAAAKVHDDAIVSAIEANRAALRLLDGLLDEDVSNGQ